MTLTEVSKLTKKGMLIFGFLVVVYIIIRVFLGGVVALKNKVFPPPESVPEMAYSKLTPLELPLPQEGEVPTYQLEIGKSELEDTYKIFPVYKMKPITPSYLAADKAQEIAKKLGFTHEPEVQIKGRDEIHVWNQVTQGRILKIDLRTWTVQLETDLKNPYQIIYPGSAPYPTTAESSARNQLKSLGLLPEDYAEGNAEAKLMKLEGGKLVRAASTMEAQISCVHFYRRGMDLGINIYPVYPPQKEALVKICLTQTGQRQREDKVLFLNYFHQKIDTEDESTYPLKTFKQAWEEAQQYPAGTGVEKVAIDHIELAYYEDADPQSFLQPIYVFEGYQTFADDRKQEDFVRFIPAVHSSATSLDSDK